MNGRKNHEVVASRLFEPTLSTPSDAYSRVLKIARDEGFRPAIRVAATILQLSSEKSGELRKVSLELANELKDELGGDLDHESAVYIACCTLDYADVLTACNLLDKRLIQLDESVQESHTMDYRSHYNATRELLLAIGSIHIVPTLVDSHRHYMIKSCGFDTPNAFVRNLGLDLVMGNGSTKDSTLLMRIYAEYAHQSGIELDMKPVDFAMALKQAQRRKNTSGYDEYFDTPIPVQGVLF